MDTAEDCEKQASGAFEGVHFHWYMEGVDQEAIEEISDSGGEEGTVPSAGNTQEAPPEEAYDKSGCHQDMEETYRRFIALRYSYAFSEFQARDGYIRHDLHPDDLPIEIITTDSSENGANAVFSGEYSKKEQLEGEEKAELSARPRDLVQAPFLKATESGAEEETEEEKDETEEEGESQTEEEEEKPEEAPETEEDRWEAEEEKEEIEEEKATPSVPELQWTDRKSVV